MESKPIRVIALEAQFYQKIIEEAPEAFGDLSTGDYRYDVIFLMNNITLGEVMQELEVRAGVDKVWQGNYAIYYRRPGPKHEDYTKSALSRIVKKPIYQNITMRNWRTVSKMNEQLSSM